MNCCRKTKRPRRELRLEHGVHLEEEIIPLEEVPDTADENEPQATLEKLVKIHQRMKEELESFESTRNKAGEMLTLIQDFQNLLQEGQEEFESVLYEVREYGIVKSFLHNGPKYYSENLLKTIKDDDLKEHISKIKEERHEREKNEKELLNKLNNNGNFKEIQKEITPKALMNCESSSLLMAMKVSSQLRTLADKKGADEEKYNQLANSVEAFTACLLDPLRSDEDASEEFGALVLDNIIEDAIDLDQKKFFTHPVVEDEMNRKFHGRYSKKDSWTWWQLLLFRFFYFWRAVDWCIFPILFTVFSLMKERGQQVRKRKSRKSIIVKEEEDDEEDGENGNEKRNKALYQMYWSPYAKFLRDTLSYIIMVVLHYALCLSPSTIAFSRLELAILIFFVGRFLVELQQIFNIKQRITRAEENINEEANKDPEKQAKNKGSAKFSRDLSETLAKYLSDPWNLLDFISISMYLIILTLRITTVLRSGSEMNNRVLAIAGYLYSLNTLCLTLRVFGYITEQSRHLGVIQIALFNILKDISTIILQFLAGILAFSIAITKVYMAEKSFIASGDTRNDISCKNSGLSCWWAMVTHLGWSLLGQSEKSDLMAPVDFPSDILVQILYALFLVFAVVLLLNMLIALLCNTYQRIEDNSLKVWLMKRAVTIQTYDAYDPAPVPINIVYNIGKLFIWLVRKFMGRKEPGKKATIVPVWIQRAVIEELDMEYSEMFNDSFPATDEDKIQLVMYKQDEHSQKMEENRKRFEKRVEQVQQLVGQVLHATFTLQGGGPEMWKQGKGIRIEGPLLTCTGYEQCGARYLKPFSKLLHFEVVILETGEEAIMGIGVVSDAYSAFCTFDFPGRKRGSVGFDIDSGQIIHSGTGKETKGPVVASRGDRMHITVMFENETVNDGKKLVPVTFYLNGEEIFTTEGEHRFFIDSDRPLYPYVCMTDGCRALAKMCPRKVEALDRKVEDRIEVLDKKLNTVLAKMADAREEHELWKVHPGISIEGRQLTCECKECAKFDVCCLHGARYRHNLSPEFPHFEVVILETGEKRGLGIGVVREHYYMNVMPGWDVGSIGYHINDGIICPKQKETKGKIYYTCFARTVMAQRGDRIRCTVMFENETVMDGKVEVPILLFLNGRKIITQEGEDQFFIDFNKPLFPFICMTDGGSVLAKICPREACKIEDVESKVTKSLGKRKWQCDKMWKHREEIGIDDRVLSLYVGIEDQVYGARYCKPFSTEFPHFEVVILKSVDAKRLLGIGVVYDDSHTYKMLGWDDESVVYRTDDGKIYRSSFGKNAEGPVKPKPGDRIRITVMFKNGNDGERQAAVSFFLNGGKMITTDGEDQFFMDGNKPLYPYVGMVGKCRAWAKMLGKDEPDDVPRWLEEFIEQVKQE